MEVTKHQMKDLKKRLFEDRDICPHALEETISILHNWMKDHQKHITPNITWDLLWWWIEEDSCCTCTEWMLKTFVCECDE